MGTEQLHGAWSRVALKAAAEVAALRRAFADPSPAVRERFDLKPDGGWSVPVTLLAATRESD